MSSVLGVSASLGSDLQQQLSSAISEQQTDVAQKLASLIQQTQSQNYLSDLLGSVSSTDANDRAALETLQALSAMLSQTQESFLEAIAEAPADDQTSDSTQTLYPVTAASNDSQDAAAQVDIIV